VVDIKIWRENSSIVTKKVEGFHDCGDPENGFKLFVCEGGHDVRHVPIKKKIHEQGLSTLENNHESYG